MADDHLRLLASVEDKFTGPLAKLKTELHGVGAQAKTTAGAMAKDWDNARGAVSKFQGVLGGFQPILSAVGVSSFGAVLTFGGIANAVRNFTSSTRDMRLMGREIGMTVDQLRTFNALGDKFGITAGAMQGAAKQFAEQMTDLQKHGQTYVQLQAMNLSKLADDVLKAPDMASKMQTMMEGLKQMPDAQTARVVSRMFFGTDDVALVARNIVGTIKGEFTKMGEAVGKIDKDTEQAAVKFEEHMTRIGHAAERAKLKFIGPLAKGMSDIMDQQDEAEKDPKGVLLRNLAKERADLNKLIKETPEWRRQPLEDQRADLDQQIREADPDGSVRKRLQEGRAIPEKGPGSVANDQRIADLEAKRKDAQERLDWNEANKSRVDPTLLPGRQRELSDEIKKLTEEMRRLREGGGATAQQSSFGGGGPLSGGGSLIQNAAFGGGAFGGIRRFGGVGMGGGGPLSGRGGGGEGGKGTGPLSTGGGSSVSRVIGGTGRAGKLPRGGDPEVVAYIRHRAASLGIDPDMAVRVARTEALNVFDPNAAVDRGGDQGTSFGPFQLHYKNNIPGLSNGGMGDDFSKETGLDARNPKTWRAQVDFALKNARRKGWGAWHGARNNGIPERAGIGTYTGPIPPNPDEPRNSQSADGGEKTAPASPRGLDGQEGVDIGNGLMRMPNGAIRSKTAGGSTAAIPKGQTGPLSSPRGPLSRPADQDDRAAQRGAPVDDDYRAFRAWKESEARAGRSGEEDEDDATAFKKWKTRKAAGPLPPRKSAGQALLERVLPAGGRGRDGVDGLNARDGKLHIKVEGPKDTKVTHSLDGLFRETKISHIGAEPTQLG